jgi:ankyrin repeat protein
VVKELLRWRGQGQLKDKQVNPADLNNEALRWASRNGHSEVVKVLLKDSRVNPADNNNQAIIWASRDGHVKVVEVLLKNPNESIQLRLIMMRFNGLVKMDT